MKRSLAVIVHWGPGSVAPHTHEFFAQHTIRSTTSPGDLMTAVPTAADNCYGPTETAGTPSCVYLSDATPSVCDKSGYWVPELLFDLDPTNTASTLVPAYMNIYWLNEYTNPTLDSPFPDLTWLLHQSEQLKRSLQASTDAQSTVAPVSFLP